MCTTPLIRSHRHSKCKRVTGAATPFPNQPSELCQPFPSSPPYSILNPHPNPHWIFDSVVKVQPTPRVPASGPVQPFSRFRCESFLRPIRPPRRTPPTVSGRGGGEQCKWSFKNAIAKIPKPNNHAKVQHVPQLPEMQSMLKAQKMQKKQTTQNTRKKRKRHSNFLFAMRAPAASEAVGGRPL